MANYSNIFPSIQGSSAVNTLLLLRPINGVIVDLVSGYSPTEMYYHTSTEGENGKIETSTQTYKFTESIYMHRAIFNTLGNHFYNSDFTIECWYRMEESSVSSDFNTLFARTGTLAQGNLQSFYMGFKNNNFGAVVSQVDGTEVNVLSGTLPLGFVLNEFNHFALVRYQDKISCFLNGIKEVESGTIGNILDINNLNKNKMSNGLAIGGGWFNIALNELNTRSRNGWYEEIRVSSIARYTADFTPPNAPFTID